MKSTPLIILRSWEDLLGQLQLEVGKATYYHYCFCPEWRAPPRVLPDEQLHLINRGQIEYRIGKKLFQAKAHDIVFCPPQISWEARRISKDLIEMIVIHFQARFPGDRRYLEAFNYPVVLRLNSETFKKLRQIATRLCRLHSMKAPGCYLIKQALLYEFFHLLFPLRGKPLIVDRDGEKILKLIEYMHEHYHDPITQESLGRVVFLSASHLAMIFRKYTGWSPIDYLIELRLTKACELLEHNKETIAEIASKVGYEDPAYFSRLFRRRRGIAPAIYRTKQLSLT